LSLRTPNYLFVIAIIALLVGLAGGYSIASWQPEQRQKIVIAIQPTQTVEEITPEAKELEKVLEDASGLDIEIYIPLTYAGVIEALRFGQAQVAMMSAWPAYIASRIANSEVVLAEVREVIIGDTKTEAPYYFSYWVVLKESPFRELKELRGARAAFPSPLSTSGYVYPLAKLVELGLVEREAGKEADPKSFFSDVIFAGGYAQAWYALRAGQVDVAVIAGDVSEKLYREVLENTRVIEQQGPIPSHGVIFSKNLPQDVRERLIKAFLKLGEPEYRGVMRKLVSAIFVRFEVTSTEKHLSELAKALELTGLKFTIRVG
jgi:phosphonate transport system substrate-binding protein